MKFNLVAVLAKLPEIIRFAVVIADKIKGAKKGPEKKAVVMESIPEVLNLIEFVADKDLFNDPVIAELLSAAVDAEALALKTRDALKAGILTKTAAPVPPPA